jgi:hypothetical protein
VRPQTDGSLHCLWKFATSKQLTTKTQDPFAHSIPRALELAEFPATKDQSLRPEETPVSITLICKSGRQKIVMRQNGPLDGGMPVNIMVLYQRSQVLQCWADEGGNCLDDSVCKNACLQSRCSGFIKYYRQAIFHPFEEKVRRVFHGRGAGHKEEPDSLGKIR